MQFLIPDSLDSLVLVDLDGEYDVQEVMNPASNHTVLNTVLDREQLTTLGHFSQMTSII